MAKVSIVVPFHNSEGYIDRCMNSLLNQTIGLQNLELILVDDASTDGTLDLLKAYEKKYPKQIILIPCVQNGRQGRARNIGLQYATAPYVGFMDSDDWIEADMYEKMYKKITRYHCDIVHCRHIRNDGTSIIIDSRNEEGKEGKEKKESEEAEENKGIKGKEQDKIFEKSTGKQDAIITIEDDKQREKFLVSDVMGVGVWDKLYRRELIMDNKIVFPEGLAYEDICFGAMMYLYAKKIYILEERLYHYYVNWESTVLKMNQPYHLDIFKVNEMKWQEYEERGALKRFPMAVKYDFVKCYYLAGMKMLLLRYTKPSYEAFLHIKQRVWELTGDYKENPYLKNAFPAVYDNLLKLLDVNISEEELWQLADTMKQMANL